MSSYVPTDWVDGVTPVDAAHMDNLEAGVVGAVAKDSVVPAATRLVQSKLLVGDANQAFKIGGDGRIDWGAGGATALDANLYRSAADVLKTDDQFQAGAAILAATGTARQIALGADVLGGGQPQIWFGTALDTNLYRSAANILKTDDNFFSAAAIVSGEGGAGQMQITVGIEPKILFGLAGDTNLYRFGANILGSDDAIASVKPTAADYAIGTIVSGNWNFVIQADGKMLWGTAADTNLYRSAANQLRTDGRFLAGSIIYANNPGANEVVLGWNGAAITAGMLFGADTNLYRSAADLLKTDDALQVVGTLYLGSAGDAALYRVAADYVGTANNVWLTNDSKKLYFGSAADTGLYRESATVLKTDTHLVAGLQIQSYRSAAGQIALSTSDSSGTGAPTIRFGLSGDTTLYRAAAGVLKTDGVSQAAGRLHALVGSSQEVRIGDLGPGGESGIAFYTTADTRLYRSAAATLKTDGQMYVVSTLQSDVDIYARVGTYRTVIGLAGSPAGTGPGIGMGVSGSQDTYLYRHAAATLRTDGSLLFYKAGDANGQIGIQVDGGGAGIPRIFFGAGGATSPDTTFDRPSFGLLRANGQLHSQGGLATKTKAGIPTDADLISPINGSMIVDETNRRLYVRIAAGWVYATLN